MILVPGANIKLFSLSNNENSIFPAEKLTSNGFKSILVTYLPKVGFNIKNEIKHKELAKIKKIFNKVFDLILLHFKLHHPTTRFVL